MKNKICKCGHAHNWHVYVKPPACDFDDCTCKKFEPQEDCGHSDALHKKYGMGDDCKPKNHSHPEGRVVPLNMNLASGSDNSPKVGVLDAVKSVMDKPEDNLSSKRKELRKDKYLSQNMLLDLVEQQDKDFIKKLKYYFRTKMEQEIIDKLAGEELLE